MKSLFGLRLFCFTSGLSAVGCCRLAAQEHWDEHLGATEHRSFAITVFQYDCAVIIVIASGGRHYYVNKATQKVTWKHPTVTNQRGKFGQAGSAAPGACGFTGVAGVGSCGRTNQYSIHPAALEMP